MDKNKSGNLTMSSNINVTLRFNFIYIMIGWIFFSFFTVFILYGFESKNIDDFSKKIELVKLFFILVGAGVTILTIYVQTVTSKKTLLLMQNQEDIEKKKVSLSYLAKWDSNEFQEKRIFYRGMRGERNSLGAVEFVKKINETESYRNALLDIANFFEDIEQAIINDIADEALLKNGFQPLVSNIYSVFSDWFKDFKNTDQNYHSQFAPFFNLLEKWK